MDYIYHQLLKLYSGISDGIADDVAIENCTKFTLSIWEEITEGWTLVFAE